MTQQKLINRNVFYLSLAPTKVRESFGVTPPVTFRRWEQFVIFAAALLIPLIEILVRRLINPDLPAILSGYDGSINGSQLSRGVRNSLIVGQLAVPFVLWLGVLIMFAVRMRVAFWTSGFFALPAFYLVPLLAAMMAPAGSQTIVSITTRLILVAVSYGVTKGLRQSARTIVQAKTALRAIALMFFFFAAALATAFIVEQIYDALRQGTSSSSVNQNNLVDKINGNNTSEKIMVIISVLLVAPLAEEVVFRRPLMDAFNRSAVSVPLSGFVFMMMHVAGAADIEQIFLYAGTGIFLSLAYWWTHNIHFSWFGHLLMNAIAVIIIVA